MGWSYRRAGQNSRLVCRKIWYKFLIDINLINHYCVFCIVLIYKYSRNRYNHHCYRRKAIEISRKVQKRLLLDNSAARYKTSIRPPRKHTDSRHRGGSRSIISGNRGLVWMLDLLSATLPLNFFFRSHLTLSIASNSLKFCTQVFFSLSLSRSFLHKRFIVVSS
jgi:hypothetical protein